MAQQSLNNSVTFGKPHSEIFGTNPRIKKELTQSHIRQALEPIKGLGLEIEICGSWVWIFDANGSHETQLRAANFQCSYRRGCWYFCAGQSKTIPPHQFSQYQLRDMDKIREKYGSQVLYV